MYVIIYASVKNTANGTEKWVKMVKNFAISYTTFRTEQNENSMDCHYPKENW